MNAHVESSDARGHNLPQPGVVHVWYVDLDQAPTLVDASVQLLSGTELERMQRYRFTRDARRFAVRRGALRSLLARYLAVAPREIRYRTGPQGKLSLPPEDNSHDLRFNLSFSGEVAVCAFAVGQEIGVDIEQVKVYPDALQVATRFFSADEIAWLQTQAHDRLSSAFLRCWTAKEAVIKALGGGLSLPLQAFGVHHWERPMRVVWPGRDPVQAATVRILSPPPGYLAALVGMGHVDTVDEFVLPPTRGR